MVSINNNLGNLSNLGNSQSVIRPRPQTSTDVNTEAQKNFSALLNIKTDKSAATQKTEKPVEELSTYSPLMMRYGSSKINEIKSIASNTGINNISNEDFDYAIRYGRSLLADYLV